MVSTIISDVEQEIRLGGAWYDTPTELAAQPEIGKMPGSDPIIEEKVQPVAKKKGKKS